MGQIRDACDDRGGGQVSHLRLDHAVGRCQHPPPVHEDSPTQVGTSFLQRHHVWTGVGGSLVTTNDVGLKCVTSWGEEQVPG